MSPARCRYQADAANSRAMGAHPFVKSRRPVATVRFNRRSCENPAKIATCATLVSVEGYGKKFSGIREFGHRLPRCDDSEKSGDLASPILMRVIGGAFQAIAKEMAGVLYRMSYSSIIRESEDLGAGIFERNGHQLAESDLTPMFMGAMPKIVRNVIRILGDDIHEGDIIFHNDPYAGATHSPDCAIVIPIFHEGEIVGYSGASAHLVDTGGAFPGLNMEAIDIYAESKIYRAMKLVIKGVRQEQLWKHILDNVRTPTHNRGDMEALIAACELAKRRFLELVTRYGKDMSAPQATTGWTILK